MTLVGIDLNSTRARACQDGAAGLAVLPLDAGHAELPLALSLVQKTPGIGRPGLEISRKLAHLACTDFLPFLGADRKWMANRHCLDAAGAFTLMCRHIQPRLARSEGVLLALPAYLGEGQAELAIKHAMAAKCNVLASVPTPIAAVLAAQEFVPWNGLAVVVDADGYAMTLSAVTLGEERARLVDVRTINKLGTEFWLRGLIDGVAHRCVRLSRRDPRACGDTEQSLYEQLLRFLERETLPDLIELKIQSPHWYQNLIVPAAELAGYTATLAVQARTELTDFSQAVQAFGPLAAIVLTGTAARLPGLAAVLHGDTGRIMERAVDGDTDFGEGLLEEKTVAVTHALEPDAVARAAAGLAGRVHRGELLGGWLHDVPFPGPHAVQVQSGPARLSFQGRDHPIDGVHFALGRDPSCDLVFPSELYPSVSARHCEIGREQDGFVLHDHSRHGTFINERRVDRASAVKAGDWIRLGPGGPLLRLLGEPAGPVQLATFA